MTERVIRHHQTHVRLIEHLTTTPRKLDAVLEEAMAFVAEVASAPASDYRPCAYDHLVSTYEQLDGPGYAETALGVVGQLLADAPPTRQCWYCLNWHRLRALLALGRGAAAAAICAGAAFTLAGIGRDRPHDRWWRAHHLTLVRLAWAEALAQGGDHSGARRLFALTPRSAVACDLLDRWHAAHVAVHIEAGALERALAIAADLGTGAPRRAFLAAATAATLARALEAAERWSEARPWAERAATAADFLGAVRVQADAHLVLGRAGLENGDARAARERARVLAEVVPRLRSTSTSRPGPSSPH